MRRFIVAASATRSEGRSIQSSFIWAPQFFTVTPIFIHHGRIEAISQILAMSI
jgi:hypothetical protein